ncbi:hypothetical protein [Psychromonas arctica]|uniref:hypothetical protein n=1 Tax=Psychromonas arctica TaxID=168275 RepID=UPI002FD24803
MDNRIKYALNLDDWSFEDGNKATLKKNAKKILVSEYIQGMKGQIFCPECCANLYRSPKEKDVSDSGRKAYFAHSRGIKTDCGLRTKRAEGKKYSSEEEAQKAIQNEELVIVEGFIKTKPISPKKDAKEYDQTPVEELDGPEADVPIGRHRGDSFKLPSKFKTVRGLVTKFDDNINRYFFMPRGQYAVQLIDLMTDISTVSETDDKPRLYYGKIIKSFNAGKTPKNIRMTKLAYKHRDHADFYFKQTDEEQQEKGISGDSKGRVVLMYGIITENGAGLCIENLGWGEFALLPQKYENLLY